MSNFETTPPIPYVLVADKAAEVRLAIDAARLSAANSFGGLQKLAIPGPFATDAEASTGGVPDDNLYYRSDGTVRAASHISLDLAFALDKTLTARTGPTPTFSRASSGLFTNANGSLVGKTAGTTDSITPSATTLGTTQVTVTVASGSVVGWLVGQSVSLIVDTDGGNDNDASELWLVGTIVSTTATQLVFTVTEKTSTAGSQTAWTLGYRGARFDHDETGVCKGLLIEESRSNIYLRSDNFADANWTKTRLSIQTDAIIAPDGAMTADKLIEDTTVSNTHTIGSNVTPPATPHTLSVFAKKGERDFIVLRLGGTNDFFNLNTGVATTNNNSPKITNFGNGWYRCTVTSSAGTQGSFQLSADGITSSYTGDGTSGIYLWGAQLEAGAFATSYIPTTIGTAARSADVCSIEGTAFSSFYNQTEGTAVTKVTNAAGIGTTTQYPFSFSGATAVELLIAFRTTPAKDCRFASVLSNVDTLMDSANAGTLSDRATDIIGFAIKLNDFAGSLDGNLITDSTVTLPTVDRMFIGSRFDGTRHWGGHIARIQYFRKRLSNAKLQTLTTL